MQENKLLSTILQAYQLREQNQHISAKKLARACLKQFPKNPEVQCLWSLLLMDEQKYVDAGKAIRQAIRINPRKSDYHFYLGEVLTSQGKYAKAQKAYQDCIQRNKKHYLAYVRLAKTLQKQKEDVAAVRYYEKSVEINPKLFESYFELGKIYRDYNDPTQALDNFQKALNLKPNDIDTLYSLGDILKEENQFELAIKFLKKALLVDKNNLPVLNTLSDIHVKLKQYTKALALLRRSLELNSEQPVLWYQLSLCKKFETADDPDIKKMENMLNTFTKSLDKSHLCFALGKAFDDCKLFDKAFGYFKEANDIQDTHHQFNLTAFKSYISRVINTNKIFNLKAKALNHNHNKQPLFIIGATSTDQRMLQILLNQNKEVEIAWNVSLESAFSKLQSREKSKVQYPYWLKSLTSDQAQELRKSYLRQLKEDLEGNPKYIIDCSTQNYLYVGLIHYLFPKAKIIYLTREPMDACLMMYFKQSNEWMPYSFNLQSVGGFYRQFQRVMEYWQQTYDNLFLQISAELMVSQSEQFLSEVCKYLDLEKTNVPRSIKLPIESFNKWQNYKYNLDALFTSLSIPRKAQSQKDLIFDINPLDLANYYYSQGKLNRALKLLEQSKVELKDNARVHFLQGKIYTKQHQWTMAEQAFRKSISADPKFYLAYGELSASLSAQNKSIEAGSIAAKQNEILKSTEKTDAKLQSHEKDILFSALDKPLEVIEQFEKKIVVYDTKNDINHEESTSIGQEVFSKQYLTDLSFGRFSHCLQDNKKRWHPKSWHMLFKYVCLIENILKINKEKVYILDMGCSSGYVRRFLEGNIDIYTRPLPFYWGIDLNEKVLRQAARDEENIEFGAAGNQVPTMYVAHDVKKGLPFTDEFFDVIINFEMLKYLTVKQGKRVFQEIHRVLKPEGQLFCSITHNSKHNKHLDGLSNAQMEKLIDQAGFNVDITRGSQASIYQLTKGISKAHSALVQDLLNIYPPEIVGAMITPLYPHLSAQITYYCQKKLPK